MSGWGHVRYRAQMRGTARFEARYPGVCALCDERIRKGDLLRWEGDDTVHADCVTPAQPETEYTVCPRCHLTTAVNGLCGCDE